MKRVKNSAGPIEKAVKDLQKDDRRICTVTKDNTIVRFGCEWYGMERSWCHKQICDRDTTHGTQSAQRAATLPARSLLNQFVGPTGSSPRLSNVSPTASSDTSFIDLHSNYCYLPPYGTRGVVL